jgi:hypothetical protein
MGVSPQLSVPSVVLVVLLFLPGPTAIRVEDVPTFALRCRLGGAEEDFAGAPADVPVEPTSSVHGKPRNKKPPHYQPQTPDATFFFGDRDDMVGRTGPKSSNHSYANGSHWSAPPINVTAEFVNATAHGYPNVEPPTHPFFSEWIAVSAKLIVRLSPALANRTLSNETAISCQLTYTGRDTAQPPPPPLTGTIALKYTSDLCTHGWRKEVPFQPCGGALGLMLGRDNTTGAPKVQTWRQLNAERYWPAMHSLPSTIKSPKLFPIVDSFRGDDDVGTALDAIAAFSKMGYHGLTVGGAGTAVVKAAMHATRQDDVHATGAGLAVPCSHMLPHERTKPSCSIKDWLRSNDTDADLANASRIQDWATTLAASWRAAGFKKGSVGFGAMHDEPGWSWKMPPVNTSTVVRARWEQYLQVRNLTPAELGAADWSSVTLLGREDARQRLLLAAAAATRAGGDPSADAALLTTKKLYYWSVRYVGSEPSQFFANATTALIAAWGGPTKMFANWNNFQGAQFVPGGMGATKPGEAVDDNAVRMSFDWFEYARARGSLLLWTEDWMPDSASFRWSYYAARLRSAVALGAHDGMEFSGYIVPRSSGGREGGLFQRILAMIGSGAKGLRYFIFGPEYTFPVNCYTDNANYTRLIKEMAQAHGMVASSEEVLWPARRAASQVAILMPRSSEMWDLFPMLSNTNATGYMHECCVTSSMLAYAADYNAEVFGLYTALAVDSGIPVDFLDEDALLELETLAQYKAIYLTEPNIPRAGMAGVVEWVTKTGGVLVTVSNAATFDEYNEKLEPAELHRSGQQQQQEWRRPRWYLQGSHSADSNLTLWLEQHGGCKFGPPHNTTVCEMPSSRFGLPAKAVLGPQELFTVAHPYGKYVLGPDRSNILGGPNRERR